MDNNFLNRNQDLKSFIVSLDKAIKVCFAMNESDFEKLTPIITLGDNKEFSENDNSKQYSRPFINISLDRRETASLTDTKFFSGMKQHGALKTTSFAYSENEESYFLKDNEIALIIRAKTKLEIYNTIQTLEKIFYINELKSLLSCNLCFYLSTKEKRESVDGFFIAEMRINVRTVVEKTSIDNVFFDKVSVNYSNLCSYFDLASQKCTYSKIHGTKAEGETEADDFRCYSAANCKDYEK